MSEFKTRPWMGLVATCLAGVALLFTFALAILLLADHVKLSNMDPLHDPVLTELRAELGDLTAKDAGLVEQIRTYDLYARRAFFDNQAERRVGGGLLLAGALIGFLALQLRRVCLPKLPEAHESDDPDHWALNGLFRQLLAGAGILLVAIALFFSFFVQSDLSVVLQRDADAAAQEPLVVAEPTVDWVALMNAQWPALRGPGGFGVAAEGTVPLGWDVEAGEGVLWTAELYVPGYNSPVVWGDRLWFCGGDEEGLEVSCHDFNTGAELWVAAVEASVEFPEVSEDTGFAAPTMTTDGKRVYAIFATGDIAAFDFDGQLVWQKNLGVPDNPYGMGSSLMCDGSRIFVQYDHDDEQHVIALACATGDQVWKTARSHLSWSTPALIQTEQGAQLILNDEENVTAYNPVTGDELWQVECLGGEVAPSPAFNGKDIVFVANEYAQATALRITAGEPEILWQYEDFLPEIASPLAAANRFFIPTTAGDIVCLEAETGEVIWEQEFDDGFNSSPILVGDTVVAIDIEGGVYIFDALADEYTEIESSAIGEMVYATPAFANGRLLIRAEETLYCIGAD